MQWILRLAVFAVIVLHYPELIGQPAGTLDPAWTLAGIGTDYLQLQKDGKVLVRVPMPGTVGGISLARLDSSGHLDASFDPGKGPYLITPAISIPGTTITIPGSTNAAAVHAFGAQSDGKVVIAGPFNFFNDVPRNGLVRLHANGSVDTEFNPAAFRGNGNEAVDAFDLAIASDDKIYVSTRTGRWAGVNRNRGIVRLNADGTVDGSFTDSAASPVSVGRIRIQPDGRILVVEASVAGVGIARLNPDGTTDGTFSTGTGGALNFNISDLAELENGQVLVGSALGGTFNGAAVKTLFRLNANGTIDPAFNLEVTNIAGNGAGPISRIVAGAGGEAFVSGSFSKIGGVPRRGLARLTAAGAVDAAFEPVLLSANGIALQSDGKVLAVGSASVDGQLKTGTFRLMGGTAILDPLLTPAGRVDKSFNGPTNFVGSSFVGGRILQTLVLPDGKIIIAGEFGVANDPSSYGIRRLNSDGSLDSRFRPGTAIANFTGTSNLRSIKALVRRADGKLFFGGIFTEYNGTPSDHLALLNTDGSLDPSFNAFRPLPIAPTDPHQGIFAVKAVAEQPDGKVVTVVTSRQLQGLETVVRNFVTRLNVDGSIDSSFQIYMGGETLALQFDGRILVGANAIVRLNADGSLDASFQSGLDPESRDLVKVILVQPDSKILVGGDFELVDRKQSGLVRLLANGAIDPSFSTPQGLFANEVTDVSLQPDGKIVATGSFWPANLSTITENFVRLNPDGSYDSGFNAGFTGGNLESVALQEDGRIIIAGAFAAVNEDVTTPVARQDIARLGGYPVSPPSAPVILTPPASQTVLDSSTLNLSVGVAGTGPFNYQWRKDGTDIPGAVRPTFSIAMIKSSDAGSYSVAVQNSIGSAVSTPANVEVRAAAAGQVLQFQAAQRALVLSWPAEYTLQTTPSLVQPNWNTVPGSSPQTIPADGPQSYFRLFKP